MDSLILTPLNPTHLAKTEHEADIFKVVQEELSNPHASVLHIDPRGLAHFRYRMHFSRPIGSLPSNQLICLRWMRMCDYAGIPLALMRHDYEDYLHQIYTGCLHGDGNASVEFHALFHGEWVIDRRYDVQAKCLDHFTPHFHDVLNDVVGQIRQHVEAFPGGAFAAWGRQVLGIPTASSQLSGWATSS